MPSWLRRLGSTLLVLLLLAYAYAPVLTAGLSGGEFRTLVELEAVLRPVAESSLVERLGGLFEVHGFAGRPLAAASLALSRVWQSGPVGAAELVALRIENLALLVLGAICFGGFVKRLLWSWTGNEQAVAAGRAAALLIALQPLHGSAVASVAARGDLLALVLGGGGCVLFLKGRQERLYALTLVAALLALLAGAASRIALALPALVAVAEYTSSRRYRAAPVRLRTAGTTFLFGGLCVLAVPLLGELLGYSGRQPVGEGLAAGLAGRVAVGLERIGTLVLPINQTASGTLGFALAGAVVLLALQPAFTAARSAPRLWGWMLVGWAVVVLLAELLSAPVRVHPGDVTRAATLLPASVAASVGLAVAATSISGLRRALLPFVVGGAWALLAHQNAGAWNLSARVVETFRSDLVAAREHWRGSDARLLAIDPPRRVAGVDAVLGALPWMLDPLFAAREVDFFEAQQSERTRVRAISARGLAALAREPEFEGLRTNPLIAVYPDPEASPEDAGRLSQRLEPVEPVKRLRSFYREGSLDLADLPSSGVRALVVTVKEPANTAQPPKLAWLATGVEVARTAEPNAGERAESQGREYQLTGAWVVDADGTRATFDLSASQDWLLSPRVKMIYSASGWASIEEGTLLDELPAAPVEGPFSERGDWVFAPTEPLDEGTWSFELIELDELLFEEWPVELERGAEPRWIVRGVGQRIDELLEAYGGPVAWSLLRRVDGVAVERLAGRRD